MRTLVQPPRRCANASGLPSEGNSPVFRPSPHAFDRRISVPSPAAPTPMRPQTHKRTPNRLEEKPIDMRTFNNRLEQKNLSEAADRFLLSNRNRASLRTSAQP
jgi:hypothetical protein